MRVLGDKWDQDTRYEIQTKSIKVKRINKNIEHNAYFLIKADSVVSLIKEIYLNLLVIKCQ